MQESQEEKEDSQYNGRGQRRMISVIPEGQIIVCHDSGSRRRREANRTHKREGSIKFFDVYLV